MTLWSPDTCGCQIEINDTPGPNHAKPRRHVVRCDAHAALGHSHHDVLAENQRKNIVLSGLREKFPRQVFGWRIDRFGKAVEIHSLNASAARRAEVAKHLADNHKKESRHIDDGPEDGFVFVAPLDQSAEE